MNRSSSNDTFVTIIKPKSGWQFIDFKELKEYRDLFFFMVWREIKILYAQTVSGIHNLDYSIVIKFT
jgi:lipopolysaccharide transport system permease protein